MADGQTLADGTTLQAYYREIDALNRRVDALDARVIAIDEHGSRGMEGLRVELRELAKDVASLTTTFQQNIKEQRSNRFWFIGAYIGGLAPLYAFIYEQFAR